MNSQRAQELEKALTGAAVGNWAVRELIDHGKSAAVFRATSQRSECALKIFDTEIVERYGRLTQIKRIEREVALSDHVHPNLVKIYEGGQCPRTGHLYIAMQRINAPSLASIVTALPRERIRPIIREIARAARYLEERSIAHRDIKPANIVVSDNQAILLDLGVLRAISHPGGTDNDDERPFIGTLQYSPPEFLLREEEDSTEGWRAVTFYQLGAVLHDMIERKMIFCDFAAPYARLVNAVQDETPVFSAEDVPTDLIHLAERCLLKEPAVRLDVVSWDDFETEPLAETPADIAREALALRQKITTTAKPLPDSYMDRRVTLEDIAQQIRNVIRNELVGESSLPPVTIHDTRQELNAARFAVSFAPNRPMTLEVTFAIEFAVELFDATARAFRLTASAWISAENGDPSINRQEHNEVYVGLFHPEEVAKSVQNFVLPAFVEALSVQGTVEGSETTISALGKYSRSDEA